MRHRQSPHKNKDCIVYFRECYSTQDLYNLHLRSYGKKVYCFQVFGLNLFSFVKWFRSFSLLIFKTFTCNLFFGSLTKCCHNCWFTRKISIFPFWDKTFSGWTKGNIIGLITICPVSAFWWHLTVNCFGWLFHTMWDMLDKKIYLEYPWL